MLIDQVRVFCQLHGLLQPGALAVAVSGGADSLALLHVLRALSEEFGLALHAATFDHGIRGVAGGDDVRFVCDVARDWGIPVSAGSTDVPILARQWSLGLEAAARKARYAFLADIAEQVGARAVATGHNRDDQAETVLMHVIRGAGLAGLRGMLPSAPLPNAEARPVPLRVVRPLLATPRAEIDAYVRGIGIEARSDATNADTRYTRNRVRHEILPLLKSVNPEVRAALARTAELAREEAAALEATLPVLTRTADGLTISRAEFLALMIGQQRYLLRLAARYFVADIEISFEQIETALALIRKHDQGVRLRLGGDIWLNVARDIVFIIDQSIYPTSCPWMTPDTRLPLEMPISGSGLFPLLGSAWMLVAERAHHSTPLDDPLSAAIAVPPGARLELRTRTRADDFRPRGAGGHSQILSDTLINMKVQAAWRDRLPLLIINGEITWFIAPLNNGPRARFADSVTREGSDLWYFSFRQR